MEKKEFEKEFQREEKELLVLIQKDIGGAGVCGEYLVPTARFLASIDVNTGAFSDEIGLLEWMIKKESQRNDWGFELNGMTIYRVRVRRHMEKEDGNNWFPKVNNRYLLLEILESNIQQDKLDAIRIAYQTPVIIGDNKIGQFTLDRDYGWFEGTIDWLGKTCDVRLELDENAEDTADNALEVLRKLVSDLEQQSSRFSRFAAEKLVDLANEWQDEYADEDGECITPEAFVKRIEISEISIRPDGDMEITYLDDDMFLGHWIVVYANISGALKNACIEG